MRDPETKQYLFGSVRHTAAGPVFSPGSDPGSVLDFLTDNRESDEVWHAIADLMRSYRSDLADLEIHVGVIITKIAQSSFGLD